MHNSVAGSWKVQETWVSCQGFKGVSPFLITFQGGRVGRNKFMLTGFCVSLGYPGLAQQIAV